MASWCKEPTHWKRPWCWERLKTGGEGDNRGWDGWMASRFQWTWVWVGSGSWWWRGKSDVLQSMGSQSVGHDWVIEVNWMRILHAGQQRRHRSKEQTFGLSGRRQGWDDLREHPWNMYIAICKKDNQCRFDAWSRAPKAGALGQPRGIGWGGFRMEGHRYTHGWFMLMYGKNHHNIVR